jgi:hypothetical protein
VQPCPHDKRKDLCAECNPCPHGKLKDKCVECKESAGSKCIFRKRRSPAQGAGDATGRGGGGSENLQLVGTIRDSTVGASEIWRVEQCFHLKK